MKKLLAFCLCALALIACDKQKNEVLKVQRWADVVKQYEFLQDFPAYDYEMENVQYSNSFGMEQVSFFDYDCPTSNFENYKTRLSASKFEVTSDMGNSMTYGRKTNDASLIIILTYTGKNLTCQYTRQ